MAVPRLSSDRPVHPSVGGKAGPPLHYVTLREGEEQTDLATLQVAYDRAGKATRVQWQDPQPRDWDDRGVLWVRTEQNRDHAGRLWGKPKFSLMHAARQRETMQELRCSVCVGQPSRTREGYLFLLEPEDSPLEGRLTIQPPLCLPHALYGIDHCSYLLRTGWKLVRSRVPRLHGVVGGIVTLGPDGSPHLEPAVAGLDGRDLPIPYTRHKLLPWVVASQLVRRLTHVTPVNLDQELATARITHRAPRSPSSR
ncbi:hypothetical protein V2S66_18535 [Streptomyces sp. V4-01]|uniref:Uncharacterized protein n=1 Tax=Actinacidiphila polyblastidii TaxID=3110430 RepID=A0ABU7PDR6_9ACTN|nr:hypothetical protein [Streptomyces sp. V4-01]